MEFLKLFGSFFFFQIWFALGTMVLAESDGHGFCLRGLEGFLFLDVICLVAYLYGKRRGIKKWIIALTYCQWNVSLRLSDFYAKSMVMVTSRCAFFFVWQHLYGICMICMSDIICGKNHIQDYSMKKR